MRAAQPLGLQVQVPGCPGCFSVLYECFGRLDSPFSARSCVPEGPLKMLKLLSGLKSVFTRINRCCYPPRRCRRQRESSFYESAQTLEVRVLLSNVYVSPTGSDQASGSAASPWKTLQYAANNVHAGDEVIVSAGNYGGFNMT